MACRSIEKGEAAKKEMGELKGLTGILTLAKLKTKDLLPEKA